MDSVAISKVESLVNVDQDGNSHWMGPSAKMYERSLATMSNAVEHVSHQGHKISHEEIVVVQRVQLGVTSVNLVLVGLKNIFVLFVHVDYHIK